MPEKKKVWSGRMEGSVSLLMEKFSRSVETDQLMWTDDLEVNRVWAAELHEIGVYTKKELETVLTSLDLIAKEFVSDEFQFEASDEDIHVAIERRLTEIAGDAGARIHTGRSRNDQVATDARLYLKRNTSIWRTELIHLQRALLQLTKEHLGVILPGYTHWQQAQPILLSHYLLAQFWAIDRTLQRLHDYNRRLDECPLGCGAIAGSAFRVDRQRLAQKLGFSKPSPNSIDATGDRDFCAELLFVIAAFFTYLSRVCGELQIWNSHEFSFIAFSDEYATGSSMMPQKKNPDAMELIRGKSAAAIANANQLLILQRGLPLTYNRDLQEDKHITFAQLEEAMQTTLVFKESLLTATFRVDKMQAALDTGLLATDLADYLVRKGLPFRAAHEVVGQVVRRGLLEKQSFTEFSLNTLKTYSELFDEDVFDALQFPASIAQRNVLGGTSEAAVRAQIDEAEQILAGY